ncbi:MAG: DUF456 family protein [Candidatus Bipolaricaulota bacterium]
MLNSLWSIPFLLLGFGGLLLIPLGIPGTFLIVGSAAAYGALTGWGGVTPLAVLILLGLAVVGELLDFGLGMAGARKKGSSGWGMFGAFSGGIVGAFVGMPFPVVGNFVGAFVGAFLGALALEYIVTADLGRALQVGWGTFVARIFSSLLKISLGIGMLAYFAFRALT